MIAYASVREMTRSMSNSRYLSTATPTHSENASNPARKQAEPMGTVPRPDTVSIAAPATSAANPAISHFSCWRRSPDERRQLATWAASDATRHSATSRKIAVNAIFHHPAAGSSPLSRNSCPLESTCVWWPMTAPTVITTVPAIHTRPIPA
jgi:hypothetical protein